jgi:hypothetical protein
MTEELENIETSYLTTQGKDFKSDFILTSALEEAFEFAFSHTVGKKKNLASLFWGSNRQKNVADFAKAFRGKLCEIGMKKYLDMNGVSVRYPKKVKEWETDKYENFELLVNHNKRLLVKSIPYYSNLLLLDTRYWNPDASYGNGLKNRIQYDYFVLTRIKPGVIHLFENFKLTKNQEIDKEQIKKIVFAPCFKFEVTGYLTKDEILQLKNNGQILPAGAIVNGNKKLEHEYYYCQAGDLNRPNLLIDHIKFLEMR